MSDIIDHEVRLGIDYYAFIHHRIDLCILLLLIKVLEEYKIEVNENLEYLYNLKQKYNNNSNQKYIQILKQEEYYYGKMVTGQKRYIEPNNINKNKYLPNGVTIMILRHRSYILKNIKNSKPRLTITVNIEKEDKITGILFN